MSNRLQEVQAVLDSITSMLRANGLQFSVKEKGNKIVPMIIDTLTGETYSYKLPTKDVWEFTDGNKSYTANLKDDTIILFEVGSNRLIGVLHCVDIYDAIAMLNKEYDPLGFNGNEPWLNDDIEPCTWEGF